jgi:nonribosomal peptide synthetase DhbF
MTASGTPAAGGGGDHGELESSLADIWCDVLGLRSVELDDDFFDLGGHSLLAAALASRISDLVGIKFRVADVQRQPTVAAQAEAIVNALVANDSGGLVAKALQGEPSTTPPTVS